MNFRVKVCLGLISAVVLLIGIGFTSEYQLQRSVNDSAWVAHTHEVLAELDNLLAAVISAESNERGYLLIGDKDLRAAFHNSQQQVIHRFTTLLSLTRDNARQQRRLNYLRPLLVRVLAVAEDAVKARQKNRKDLALISTLALGASQQPRLQIESTIEEIRKEEQHSRQERLLASQSSAQTAHVFVDLGTVLAVIIVLVSALVIIRDLQHREKAEIALREIQEGLEARVRERTASLSNMGAQYRLLFDDSPLAMAVFDLGSHSFLAVNAAAEELYGYTREEFLAMPLQDTQTRGEGPLPMEVFNQVVATDAYRTMFASQRKDGQMLTIDARVRTIDFRGRRAQLALLTDITEQKRLEAQLLQSQKLEAVGRLAGGVAHDFNNLLTVIIGYSDMILRKLDANHPLCSKVSEIKAAAQRAANLTAQLLAFSRKQVLKPRILLLNSVVSNISQMLRRLLGEHIEVSLHLSSDLGQIRADPTQLEQVLVNLAVNARDAMPSGGKLVIETHNADLDNHSGSLAGVPPGRYVVLEVSDSGCGMDEETTQRIFEPFFTTKDVGQGTGLGLSMVLGVVQQSGGTVTVYSELGVGTTFKIYLPRLDGPEEKEAKHLKSSAAGAGGTILLAEDEERVRTWAAEVLRDAGWAVLEASNGREALEVAQHCLQAPTLLLTDVVMPEMSGPELAQTLKTKWPALPVVYASGYSEQALLGRRVLEQVIPFLQKPYTADALLEQVARAGSPV